MYLKEVTPHYEQHLFLNIHETMKSNAQILVRMHEQVYVLRISLELGVIKNLCIALFIFHRDKSIFTRKRYWHRIDIKLYCLPNEGQIFQQHIIVAVIRFKASMLC